MKHFEEVDVDLHRKLASEMFNLVWTYLDKPERTGAEDLSMVHAAHASRYHWSLIGQHVHFARGEWQISRVYAVLKRPEAALYHARKCLEYCQAGELGPFDHAFAFEALARAYDVAGDVEECKRCMWHSRAFGQQIASEDERALLEGDLATIGA